MKNIELLPSKVECNRCYSVKYICMTPDGGDYITCPICEDSEIDYLDLSDKYSKKKESEWVNNNILYIINYLIYY